MLKKSIVAHEYAKAIFDLSIEQNNVDHWSIVLGLFSEISQNIVVRSLCHKLLSTNKLSEIFIDICECFQNSELDLFSHNLVYIMSENNRLLLFPKVLEEFNILRNIYMRFIEIEVTSAKKLRNDQLQKISDMMERRLSKKVKIICNINRDIIDGIVIRIEDTVIDGSLQGRILRLSNILKF